MSQARFQPEILVNFRPEPGPTYNSGTSCQLVKINKQYAHEFMPSEDRALLLAIRRMSLPLE